MTIFEGPAPKAPASSGAQAEDLGALPIWDLSDLYKGEDDPQLAKDRDSLSGTCEAFASNYASKLAEGSADLLLDAITDYEKIQITAGRLGSFAGLRFQQNMADADRTKFQADIDEAVNEATAHLVFFSLEVNQIEDDALEAMLSENEALARFRPILRRLRAMRPHQLSAELEAYQHDAAIVGHAAWNTLFDESMAAMTFDVDGEALGLEATLNLLSDPDRARREAGARAVAEGFKKDLPLYARITNTLAKMKQVQDKWRKFDAPNASRHLANDVEPEVVQALRDAVVAAYPRLSHRYYRLKAKWLGLDKLQVWDRNAPLPDEDDRTIPWSEARNTVETAYRAFDPRLADITTDFFEKNWIDAAVTPGKTPGAFSASTVTTVHPYVLMNYLGKQRDVMTLAHELGHAVHQTLAAEQGELLSSTPLTLAETASVFGEMLTFRKLLDGAEDDRARKILLAGKVEDMINTVVRQIAFYDFEVKLHDARANGELTADQINEIWMSVQAESLGPVFEFMEGYETFWAYIPHFIHVPFYVYAYAFGDSLVNALYAVFEEGDPAFKEKYYEMLKAGGSKHHSELLTPFGLDATDPAFWQKGLGLIERMIIELEEIDARLS